MTLAIIVYSRRVVCESLVAAEPTLRVGQNETRTHADALPVTKTRAASAAAQVFCISSW